MRTDRPYARDCGVDWNCIVVVVESDRYPDRVRFIMDVQPFCNPGGRRRIVRRSRSRRVEVRSVACRANLQKAMAY
jgi:hypothetical protein